MSDIGGYERAYRRHALYHLPAAVPYDQADAYRTYDLDRRVEDRVKEDRLDIRLAMRVVDPVEAVHLFLFAVEELDDRHPGYVLLKKSVDARYPQTDFAKRRARAEAKPYRQRGEQRQNCERDERELPVDLKHPYHYVKDHGQVAEYDDHARRKHLVERIDVRSKPGHQPPDRVAVIKLHGQLLQMREDLLSKVVHYVLPHGLHYHGLGVLDRKRRDAGDQKDYGYKGYPQVCAPAESEALGHVPEKEREPGRRRRRVGGDEQVYSGLRKRRACEHERRAQYREHERYKSPPPVGPEIPEQPPHQPRVIRFS
jgi:hypothetical protein